MNLSNSDDDNIEEQMMKNIIGSLRDCYDPLEVLEKVRASLDFLPTCNQIGVEAEILRHIMPAIREAVAAATATKDISPVGFIDMSHIILDYVMGFDVKPVEFALVASLPSNLASVILSLFRYCETSQNKQNQDEILILFRKVQGLHSKYLVFLENVLIFNVIASRPDELIHLTNVMVSICDISEILLRLNVKSMSDNWKCYLVLVQKYSNSTSDNDLLNLSLPVRILTGEIRERLAIANQNNQLKTPSANNNTQNLKITGFLIKVAWKLFEINLNLFINNYFMDLLTFSTLVYSFTSCGSYFGYCEFLTRLSSDKSFLKMLCSVKKIDIEIIVGNNYFGFVIFVNKILTNLSVIMQDNPEHLGNYQLDKLFMLLFSCLKHCFRDFNNIDESNNYFYGKFLYDDLVINMAICVLSLPSTCYGRFEKFFLKNLLQNDDISSALLATDVWCLILKNCSTSTCIDTLLSLIEITTKKINLGKFIQTPSAIYLKNLMKRLFKLLPHRAKIDILTKFRPVKNQYLWTWIGFDDVLMFERFHIDAVLNDFYEKINLLVDNNIVPNNNILIDDTINLIEMFDLISTINFNQMQLNCTKLLNIIGNNLWQFEVNQLLVNNYFYQYYICKLCKLTNSLVDEFGGEHLLTILFQLKKLSSFTDSALIFSILLSNLLFKLSKRNIDHLPEKQQISSLIINIFYDNLLFINNNNLNTSTTIKINRIIALKLFQQFINYGYYNNVVTTKKLLTIIINQTHEFALDRNKNVGVIESTFRHQCLLQWSSTTVNDGDDDGVDYAGGPYAKKIKIDDNQDCNNIIIDRVAIDVQRLMDSNKIVRLSTTQKGNVQKILCNLQSLL